MAERSAPWAAPIVPPCSPAPSRRPAITLGRIGLLLAVLLLLAPPGMASSAATATATPTAAAPSRAGLVVRHRDGRLTYASIPFAEASISGLELLKRGLAAGEIPLVTIGFGGLGEGVCRIAEEGCSAGECRRRVCQGPRPDDPYWRYFRQAAPGDWRPLPLGASGTEVHDGDVDAWSWTGGDVGLPALSLAEVVALAGAGEGTSDRARPVARTVSPPGTAAPAAPEQPAWPIYAGAAGILTAIAGGALVAARHRSTRSAP